MKGSIIAAVAALGGAEAANLHHRHSHPMVKKDAGAEDECTCSTIIETIYGEPTLVGLSPVVGEPEPTIAAVPETTVVVEEVVVPTIAVEVCPTPGTYTFPATTITLTDTTTVCGGATTSVPAGTHTLGGVTTVVETATTVVCPYATTSVDDNGVVTSVIETTTYVCPSAGTYTIAPVTTECAHDTVIVVPVVETYTPGTYTRPQVVTTITETQVVVFCPYTVSPVAEPTSEPEIVTEVEATPTAVPEVEEEEVEEEVEEKTPVVSTPSKNLGSGNDHWAMTYTPYTNDSQCKSQSQIDSDIAAIAAAGFTAVRVYSTDCNTLPYIGGACTANGLKIILGIFVNGGGCTNSNPTVPEQINAIAAWAKWDMVETIVVGNEAILNGYCTASQIADLVSQCRTKFSGYSGPYTTAETLNIWENPSNSAILCDALDVVGANIHPYFNAGVVAAEAGSFVAGQLSLIDQICPGKTGINLECGWPSAGNCIGTACPGADNQAAAIKDIRAKVGDRTCFFSFTDDLWKNAGSCGCEQSWGCGSLF